MKQFLQFCLSSLLAFTAIAGLAFTWTRPFNPSVSFTHDDDSAAIRLDGTSYRFTRFVLRNDGMLPIWCVTFGPHFSDVETTQSDASVAATEVWLMPDQAPSWICIMPGASVSVYAPFEKGTGEMRIGVALMDWRGRRAVRNSQKIHPNRHNSNQSWHRDVPAVACYSLL